ncbi:carbohydrate ABC transporter permease [Microbacterium sulfonylureivorans]|uniref:carbohydrate ABC transporter permease n=1 Tax=Microbacterium sulfonylureivorans TaxID=2486854 RepID=UPI00197C9351|nr:sugar ABC transporter permease [Microbacterium sulfonylureivorans]
MGAILLIPFAYTVIRSFFGAGETGFVGFGNYVSVFQDPSLQLSMLNTLLWALGALIIPVGVALLIAVMTQRMRFGETARALMILPYALAGAVVGVFGHMLFATNGSLNQALQFFGMQSAEQPIGWLLHWPLNVISTILIASWQATGVNLMLFTVGLQTIPRETLEAGAIDGAEGWTRFRHIVFPQLRATTAIVVGITIANALRAFDVIFVLTHGGPNRTSENLALSMYQQTFTSLDPAVGSAIAIVLTVIVVGCSWSYLRTQLGKENY